MSITSEVRQALEELVEALESIQSDATFFVQDFEEEAPKEIVRKIGEVSDTGYKLVSDIEALLGRYDEEEEE